LLESDWVPGSHELEAVQEFIEGQAHGVHGLIALLGIVAPIDAAFLLSFQSLPSLRTAKKGIPQSDEHETNEDIHSIGSVPSRLNYRHGRLSKNGGRYYRNGWRLLKQSKLADMRIDRVTNDDVVAYGPTGQPYTVNNAIRTLRRILSKCLERGLIAKVPKLHTVREIPRDIIYSKRAGGLSTGTSRSAS